MSRFRPAPVISDEQRKLIKLVASDFEQIEARLSAIKESRLKAIALTQLEIAAMAVNKAIAHREPVDG